MTGVTQQKMVPTNIQELRKYIEVLEDRIKELEKKPAEVEIEKKFKDVEFYPLLKIDKFILKYDESTAATEPTILSNQVMLWKDTTNTKYYLKANFNGTAKKVELT